MVLGSGGGSGRPSTTTGLAAGTCACTTYEHSQQGALTGLAYSTTGDAIATSSADGTVCVWGAAVSGRVFEGVHP
jgi:WD40 repeat protein